MSPQSTPAVIMLGPGGPEGNTSHWLAHCCCRGSKSNTAEPKQWRSEPALSLSLAPSLSLCVTLSLSLYPFLSISVCLSLSGKSMRHVNKYTQQISLIYILITSTVYPSFNPWSSLARLTMDALETRTTQMYPRKKAKGKRERDAFPCSHMHVYPRAHTTHNTHVHTCENTACTGAAWK